LRNSPLPKPISLPPSPHIESMMAAAIQGCRSKAVCHNQKWSSMAGAVQACWCGLLVAWYIIAIFTLFLDFLG
jgi:hypothetical protein